MRFFIWSFVSAFSLWRLKTMGVVRGCLYSTREVYPEALSEEDFVYENGLVSVRGFIEKV